MIFCTFLKIVLLQQAVRVASGEFCRFYESGLSYSSRTIYCVYGCCGTKYSDVCCSYNSYSSASSGSQMTVVIVSSVVGSVVGLSILIGLIKCCCATANNSRRQTGTVIQLANTNMQAFVGNTPALHQGQSVIPAQQGAVGYGYPCAGFPPPCGQYNNVSPPPYSQHDNVSKETANPACPPPQGVKY